MAYRFENDNGDVIEVETETAANDYRQRGGFRELDEPAANAPARQRAAETPTE